MEAQSDVDGSLIGLIVGVIVIKLLIIFACCACRKSNTQSTTRVIVVERVPTHPGYDNSAAHGVARREVSVIDMPPQHQPPAYAEVTSQVPFGDGKSNVV